MRPIKTFRSKKELVYDSLRAAILEGELKPGARLIIDELAEALGVSQIPVREALQQLQADGYVVIQPYLGAKVAEIHANSIHEMFMLLEALEVISSRAACQRMSEGDFEQLEAILREMDTLTDDPERWSQENVRLHQLIGERAGTFLVAALMDKVLDHWDRLRRFYLKDVSARRMKAAQKEHWEILAALRSRDPDRVEKIVRKHNRAALADYVGYLDEKMLERVESESAAGAR